MNIMEWLDVEEKIKNELWRIKQIQKECRHKYIKVDSETKYCYLCNKYFYKEI